MKRFLTIWLALCCGATLFAARGSTTPEGWSDDFAAAKEKAKRENKPMLLLFTGSDWCGFCIKLRKEVLDKSAFKNYAQNSLVLVYIDAPRRVELPQALVEQNRELKSKYGGRGVPYTVVLSADGRILGRVYGYRRDYLARVKAIVAGKKYREAGNDRSAEKRRRVNANSGTNRKAASTPAGWLDDFEAAREKAKRENKPLLILFTGSDWCGPCKALRQGVLDTPEFRKIAEGKVILYYADMPKDPDFPQEKLERNRKLHKRFRASGGVPELAVVSPSEILLDTLSGYSPDHGSYLKRLHKIINDARENPPPKLNADGLPDGWFMDPDAAVARARSENKPLIVLPIDERSFGRLLTDRKAFGIIRKEFVPLTIPGRDHPGAERFAGQRQRFLSHFGLYRYGPSNQVIVFTAAALNDHEAAGQERSGRNTLPIYTLRPQYGTPFFVAELEATLETIAGKRKYAVPEGWTDDFEAAQKLSREQNRPLLMYFGASNHSGVDIVMRREVLSTDEFRDLVKRNFVPFYADQPCGDIGMPEHVRQQNQRLARQYRTYMTAHFVVLRPDGKCIGFFYGYHTDCVEKLRDILRNRDKPLAYRVPEGWSDDYEAALREAKKLDRPIMIIAVTSDDGDASRRIIENFMTDPKFDAAVRNKYIPLFLDYPRLAQPPERIVAQNRELRNKLRFFPPSVVVISPDGSRIASVYAGYRDWRRLLSAVERRMVRKR